MASTYSSLLRIELQGSGENSTTWGDKTNVNFETVLENAIAGAASIVMTDVNHTLSTNFGLADEARSAILLVSGTNTASRNIIVPTASKIYLVRNLTTGGFPVVVKTAAGTGVTVTYGSTVQVFCDGTNVVVASITDGSIVPSLVNTTANAWRFNSSIGVGYAQPVVANYGVIGLNGVTGSYTNYYANSVLSGTVKGSTTAFDINAPATQLTLSTNGVTRLAINNAGDVAVGGAISAGTVYSTGKFLATAAAGTTNGYAFSEAGQDTGMFSPSDGTLRLYSNGVNNLSVSPNLVASNVPFTAPSFNGFTPVQQGTGLNQRPNVVKIGWSGIERLKATVDTSDQGNFAMEGTGNTFTKDQAISGTGRVTLTTSGDITATRTNGSGVIFLGNTGRRLYWDGTKYSMPNGALGVGGSLTVSGDITAGLYNGYAPASRGANTFSGIQNASVNGQTAYGTAGLRSASSAGDVHIGLHAEGVSAASIKHTRGGSGVSIVDAQGTTLAPIQVSSVGRINPNTISYGSFGSISVVGTTNGYAGVALKDVAGVLMDNGTIHGYYRTNNKWLWDCDNSGNFTAMGNVTAYSDERLKKNWRPVADDFVAKLAEIKSGVYERIDTNETQVGVSAQSLQRLLPEAVQEVAKDPDGSDPYLTVSYGNAALAACVELAKEIVALRAEIEALKRVSNN